MPTLRHDSADTSSASTASAGPSGSPSYPYTARSPPTTKSFLVPSIAEGSNNSPGPSAPKGKDSIPPSFFPTPALDQAFAGITAGAIATVCMNPLDLIKTQFQVDTSVKPRPSLPGIRQKGGVAANAGTPPPRWREIVTGGRVARDMYAALKTIVVNDGWSGLYRGLSANVVGNSASWGLYFLW